jgi:hypothetical protein
MGQGKTEVSDAHPPASIQHNVGRLQIAMQQPAIVRGSETGADLVRGFQSLVGWQAADATEQGRKVLAVNVLHGEKMLAVYFTDVVNPTNIRMRDLARVPHLRMKRGEGSGIALNGGGKKLQRYNVAELEILSAVDLAHSTSPQQSDYPVSLGKESAGRESPALGRVRT